MGSGYLHSRYAEALGHLGKPTMLHHSGAWILERPIRESTFSDAIACYPLLLCANWKALCKDFETLGDRLVSIAAVTDPFGDYDIETLNNVFCDVSIRYKQHYIVDLHHDLDSRLPENHRRNLRKARRVLTVERCECAEAFASDWVRLYGILRERHGIAGPAAFPDSSLTAQLTVPGLAAFRAVWQGQTAGMVLWYRTGPFAYYHLAAYDEAGYAHSASFPLFYDSLSWLAAQGVRWVNLGSGAGTHSSGEDGLTRFKQGWATETRPVYFCGRIFQKERYDALVTASGISEGSYFPLYRMDEST